MLNYYNRKPPFFEGILVLNFLHEKLEGNPQKPYLCVSRQQNKYSSWNNLKHAQKLVIFLWLSCVYTSCLGEITCFAMLLAAHLHGDLAIHKCPNNIMRLQQRRQTARF